MIKELKIDDKNIQIHYNSSNFKELPVVILNTYGNEGQEVFDKCRYLNCKEFILVTISNLDWNNDMTPWFAPKLNKRDVDFLGKADDFITILMDKIIPQIEAYIKNHLKNEGNHFTDATLRMAKGMRWILNS